MPIYKTSKEAIIKQAFNVFLVKGYYHTSIADLSKACQIEKPHFYYYFKNKREIMFSVLEYIHQWAKENMFIHAYNEKLPVQKRMELLLKVLSKIHENHYNGCIFGNTALEMANNDNEFLPALKSYFKEWHNTLYSIYKINYTEKEARQKAQNFFNELNGVLLMTKVYKDTKYLSDFILQKLGEV